MSQEGPAKPKTHETEDSASWEDLLARQKGLEGELQWLRERHRKWQEDTAEFRVSIPHTAARLTELEARMRTLYKDDTEALRTALAIIQESRDAEAAYGAALEKHGETLADFGRKVADYEEALADLHQELLKVRN